MSSALDREGRTCRAQDTQLMIHEVNKIGMRLRPSEGYHLTILLRSSAEPGSTEQADSSELDAKVCEISDRYWGAAWSPVQLGG